MRGAPGKSLTVTACLLALAGCGGPEPEMVSVPGVEGAVKSDPAVRAARRLFDGAPPVIPHEDFGVECTSCHNIEGMDLGEIGFAPPMPHERTLEMSAVSRCRQCHVFREADSLFAGNTFAGLRQDLRRGDRLNPLSPPVRPHKSFMRENCVACHDGPAAREEIRTPHPDRVRCEQCHVEPATTALFRR